MSVPDYKINYKSDFVLTINGDAGWAVPFCIKFWTGMPSQAYFVGFDGVKYINCRVGDTPTQLLVMFDDHHLPIGKLKMQIAYHTTIEEFPGSVFDEVTNARDVIVTIDGTDYQVMLDFTGEDAPELEFDLPAYANEAERIQNELQRQQNEADRIAAELQREQATAAAVQGAENVNAQLNGTTLTVTNRNGVSTSVNTKGEQGEQGPVGPEGPQGEQGISIVSFRPVYESGTVTYYSIIFSDGHDQSVAIPKGAKGATGPTGPQGPQGQTGVSITGLVKTGETETDTLYNVTFSNGTTQAVAIPKGEKGDQGPVGPQGPQGPMGDVAVITHEQQAAFTMYSTTGQNTNGPMTQKAVTDNLVASAISYDNSQSGLASGNVQGAIYESIINSLNRCFSSENITLGTSIGFFIAPNAKTWTASGSSHYIIAIKPYDTFKIIANASVVSDFAFLKRNDYPVNNVAAPLSDIDNVVHRINAGEYCYATAPSDANFLYIWGTHSGVVHDPQQIIKYVDDSERDDIVDGIYDAVYNFESVTGLTERKGFVIFATASYVNVTNSSYKHKYVAREQSWKRLKVKANNTTNAAFFFVTSNPTPANQTPLPLCSGTYTNVVAAGTTQEFYIPDDCEYIIFDIKSSSSDYTPDIIEVNGESVGNLLSEETPIDLSEYDEILGWISQTGDYLGTAGSGHYVIDVRGYDKFKGIAHAINGSFFVLASAVNGNSWTKYGGRVVAPANASYEFSTDGQPYLIVGNFSSQAYRDNNNSVTPQSLSLLSNDRIGLLESRVSELEGGGSGSDIVRLNGGEDEIIRLFKTAKKADITVSSSGVRTTQAPSVILMQFSDLHANSVNLARVITLKNMFASYIDDVIHTGDAVSNTFNDDFSFWVVGGASGVLNIIGNHDAYISSGNYATETNMYNKFIAPFVSTWGVTSIPNKCYYYKDYTTNGRKLRLVCIDAYNAQTDNNAQLTWLANVLEDARTNNLHVMIAAHAGICKKSNLECNFNSMQARWDWSGSAWQNQVDLYFAPIIETFISNGGVFVCWLSGHTHCDVMGFGIDYPHQLTINIDTANNTLTSLLSDTIRETGTKGQDVVNIVAVDTYRGQLRIYRIGSNLDKYARSRTAINYDYINRNIIAQR